ncbi:hypothetical protein CONPUDRAFT_148112 [Coniophora puteana RWD-64-598 SS2]|uniref:Carboxylesterase type B domain-containing protein n=1 Tax=Coniophora puteana (strain RWD-64-598) TaxID=741705 RepID=A0A5M3N3P4_CONPW|nr:uncharacterized protein CONPUDRAFT_148112 [Coniophora puteana RWD-64-598 SS2]EIW85983.1 hypothetical protein CONPUDRAFT_148112 [Coniophora puteana RWD-64-598 SS2]
MPLTVNTSRNIPSANLSSEDHVIKTKYKGTSDDLKQFIRNLPEIETSEPESEEPLVIPMNLKKCVFELVDAEAQAPDVGHQSETGSVTESEDDEEFMGFVKGLGEYHGAVKRRRSAIDVAVVNKRVKTEGPSDSSRAALKPPLSFCIPRATRRPPCSSRGSCRSLATPSLLAAGDGNAGLHDPRNVVIAGESSSGASVVMQIAAYGGQREAPFQCGTGESIGFGPMMNDTQNAELFANITQWAGCPSSPESTALACLRTTSLGALVSVINHTPLGAVSPTVDAAVGADAFLPDRPSRFIAQGKFASTGRRRICRRRRR